MGEWQEHTGDDAIFHAHLDDDLSLLGNEPLEPIAIIGYALKFPQDASTTDGFWQMLVEGRHAMTSVPDNRFNGRAYGTNLGGHFIRDNIEAFDAPFFSISPVEAATLDPQQRGLLEVTYHALENAGIPLESVTGTPTAVHIGSFLHEHERTLDRDYNFSAKYQATGVGQAMIANRLSWFYDLKGPSMSIDTACSSSLIALHLSCQSLRNREATMGIVGGCNIFYNPDMFSQLREMNFLSPDNRCHSFDSRANGYARGEGFGVIILKPLSIALQDGDTIRAVVRSSFTNQDGRTPGITQPDIKAQETLIRRAYQIANLSMDKTGYFEAHGTGTPIGDVVEASAINNAFKRPVSNPLHVGSVKANIGHLEGASGMAGIIKSIMVLESGQIPGIADLDIINPQISTKSWNLVFPKHTVPWPSAGLRRVSINSFGFGGANAHVILDDAFHFLQDRNIQGRYRTTERRGSISDTSLSIEGAQSVTQPRILVFSAADGSGIDRHLSQLDATLASKSNLSSTQLQDLAYTLSEKRSHLAWRSFSIVQSTETLKSGLKTIASQAVQSRSKVNLGFIFTGQGAQWFAMGRELSIYPCYKKSLEKAAVCLKDLQCPWSLLDELNKSEGDSYVDNPTYSQPMLTALQIALVDLLRSWNIIPSAVVGHSSGEIAAAYCAYAISFRSALKIAYFRGQNTALIRDASSEAAGMIGVGLSSGELEPYLTRIENLSLPGSLSIACFNSPKNVTVAGSAGKIEALEVLLKSDGVFAKRLKVDMAYHTAYMRPGAAPYRQALGSLDGSQSTKTKPLIFSSLTGDFIEPHLLQSTDYWINNFIQPVQFLSATTKLLQNSHVHIDRLIEIGPHSAMQSSIREILQSIGEVQRIGYLSLLVRRKPATQTLLEAVASLHCLGYKLDLVQVNNFKNRVPRMLTELPSYSFDHSRSHWLESRISKNFRFRPKSRHPVLGSMVADWNPLHARWRNYFMLSEMPWIQDHKINGVVTFPAAGMLTMAAEAVSQLQSWTAGARRFEFRDVVLSKALTMTEKTDNAGGVETDFHLRPILDDGSKSAIWHDFHLYAFRGDEWMECCRGEIKLELVDHKNVFTTVGNDNSTAAASFDHEDMTHASALESERLYQFLGSIGLDYGPSFQKLARLRHDIHTGTTRADILFSDEKEFNWTLDPALIDSVFQLVFPSISAGCSIDIPTVVPTKIQKFWIKETQGDLDRSGLSAEVKAFFHGPRTAKAQFDVVNSANGEAVIGGLLQFKALSHAKSIKIAASIRTDACHAVVRKPDPEFLDEDSTRSLLAEVVTDRLDKAISEDVCNLAWHTVTSKLLDKVTETGQKLPSIMDQRTLSLMQHNFKGSMDMKVYRMCLSRQSAPAAFAYCTSISLADTMECEEVKKAATSLGIVLTKQMDAHPISNCPSESDITKQYYEEVFGIQSLVIKVAAYLELLAHKRPGLKLLEIATGIGSLTQTLLDHISPKSSSGRSTDIATYDHTSSSLSETERAMRNNTAYPEILTFNILDIGKDPLSQGFEAASYDVVLATKITSAIAQSYDYLRHIRTLLKPGGTLIILQMTDSPTVSSLVHSNNLPALRHSHEEVQTSSSLLTDNEFPRILMDHGFENIKTIQHVTMTNPSVMNAIISTKTTDLSINNGNPQTSILICQDSSTQVKAAKALQKQAEANSSSYDIIYTSDMTETIHCAKHFIILCGVEHFLGSNATESCFQGIKRLLRNASSVLWVGHQGNTMDAMITGLSRTYSAENEALRFGTLFLNDLNGVTAAQNIMKVQKKLLHSSVNADFEYRQTEEVLEVERIVETAMIPDHINKEYAEDFKTHELPQDSDVPLYLRIETPGLLDSIEFAEYNLDPAPLAADEIEVKIVSSTVNFRDLFVALGQLDDSTLGLEASGTVTRIGENSPFKVGDRVVGFFDGSLRTFARCKTNLVVPVPEQLGFDEAAAIPLVFCAAYHALKNVARIQPGESVLVHTGAGGLGQATIQLAKLMGAETFVTVGTAEKKQLLQERYGIAADHILYSRNLTFVEDLKRLTHDQGVDVIINSLTGEALRASWECIAAFGRFVEMGRKDITGGGFIPMSPFVNDTMFASVDLVNLIRHKPKLASKLLHEIFQMVSDQRITSPYPLRYYRLSQIEEALRFIQSGKNTGKVVVQFGRTETIRVRKSASQICTLDANATYVISGGLGGLGRSIAHWMFSRGARHLLLLTRSKIITEEKQKFLSEMEMKGMKIVVEACDIGDPASLREVLTALSEAMPPIRGCIQSAMVQHNMQFDDMTLSDFNTALRPKVEGSYNLATLLPQNLDFFIMLSSIVGIAGIFGQSNYAAGNTYQDALAQQLRKQGRHAVALNLGAVHDVGYMAERVQLRNMFNSSGWRPVLLHEILAVLDYICNPAMDVGSQVLLGCSTKGSLVEAGVETPYWMEKPLWRHLLFDTKETSVERETSNDDGLFDLARSIKKTQASTIQEVVDIIRNALVAKMSKVLLMEKGDININKPMHLNGVDSLVAVEIRNWFGKVINADIAVFEILGSGSLAELAQEAASRSGLVPQDIKQSGS